MAKKKADKNKQTGLKSIAEKMSKVTEQHKRTDLPDFNTGDTLKVHTKITEGNKERVQVFQGLVIAIKHGSSTEATFTVRKISYNVGVEKTFLLHSPRIEKIEIVSRGDVRRTKLYYLRDLRGKAARIRTKFFQSKEEVTPVMPADNGTASNQADEVNNAEIEKKEEGTVAAPPA